MSAPTGLWPCTFHLAAPCYFEMSIQTWLRMQQFRQTELDMLEGGGILFGRHLCDGSAVIVDQITTPLPGDRRGRAQFHRAHHDHQVAIDQAWDESGGTCTYLGEWHTHPEPIPIPSIVDRMDWKRRLRCDSYTEPLFFVIVGTEHVAAWIGSHSGTLLPLHLVVRGERI